MHEFWNWVGMGMHQPERLLDAAHTLAQNNVHDIERLGKIMRGRERRHSLQSIVQGEQQGAQAIRSQMLTVLHNLQPDYTADMGSVTTPKGAHVRRLIFLLRLENEGILRATEAAQAELAAARQERRIPDPALRTATLVALSKIEVRLAHLIRLCTEIQTLFAGATPPDDGDEGDEDAA